MIMGAPPPTGFTWKAFTQQEQGLYHIYLDRGLSASLCQATYSNSFPRSHLIKAELCAASGREADTQVRVLRASQLLQDGI